MNSAPLPYQAPPQRGLGTRQPSVSSLGTFRIQPSLSRRTAVLVTNFCIFTVQQRCKHLSCLLFTCAYQVSLLYTYTSLLYTCSNLLTVNVIALNTVPPGTGE